MSQSSSQTVLPIVLAAGLGTRMKSSKPKVLHELCGRPMLAYVLDAAEEAAHRRPLVVYSPPTGAIKDVFAERADFALQETPRGTADAVKAALAVAPGDVTEVVVLSGDVPLVDPELLVELIDLRRARNAAIALVSVNALDPEGLGRVLRDEKGSEVLRVVEQKDATPEELEIDEINAGVYAFDAEWLRRRIGDVDASPVSGEYYLPLLVAMARDDRRAVVSLVVEDDGTLTGINDRSQLAEAEEALRADINEAHLLAGVTMIDPLHTYIDASVELGQDVLIEPNVVLRGRTKIGQGTVIRAGSQIFDTVIGRNCVIWASVLESSEVEDEVQVGPFSHLRANSSIGTKARIGNFAEVKSSRIDAGVQQHHFSYIGDAVLGERTNVGAGTVTCNYDGTRKHKTKIGKHVFLGSDTMLIAPVELGDEARTAAGSVVTKDVPAGMLAVGIPARLRKPRLAADEPAKGAPAAEKPAAEKAE